MEPEEIEGLLTSSNNDEKVLSGLISRLLELTTAVHEPASSNSSWYLRAKTNFDLTDPYGDGQ
jgi:hypothetical protein